MASQFKPVQLPVGSRLNDEYVVFPEQGVVTQSVDARTHGGLSVALIGFEGMTGLSAVLGIDRTPTSSRVLVPGSGQRIEATRLRTLLAAFPAMRSTMLAYAHVYTFGLTHAVLSAGRGRIDARLARCLLMLDDRLAPASIPVTHDNLAEVLGRRRPGVTDMLHKFEGDHLIRSTRGVVTIRDREGLAALAGDTYGGPEREYVALFGDIGRRPGAAALSGAGAVWAYGAPRRLGIVREADEAATAFVS